MEMLLSLGKTLHNIRQSLIMSLNFFKAAAVTAALLFCAGQTANTAFAAEVIGEYANGCIKGAVPLKDGTNYQVQIWGHGRNYGHPELIDYIQKLVLKAKHYNLPDLLIGDLSKRQGGSFGSGSSHGSHQSGLDVDISFDFASPRKSFYDLSHPKDVYLVDTHNRVTRNFDKRRVALIYLAASDPRVERIFVAPGIKKTLCQIYGGHDRSWLQKLRPWFGHRGHMHVRLACPVDSPLCVNQAKAPSGDGCGQELDSWLHPEKYAHKPAKNGKPQVKKKRVMPSECRALFASSH